MILRLANTYTPDAIEAALPDPRAARALIEHERPDVLALLERRRAALHAGCADGLDAGLWGRCEDALLLSLARFGTRHGSWGTDYHHYHNENHALEILDGRLGRMMATRGVGALPALDWLALSLFATCHDLRQREVVDFGHPIGNNEAASIAETHRIFDACGMQPERDRPLYVALEMMLAGSTFDPRPAPLPPDPNPAEFIATGGALAPKLAQFLDQDIPGWRAERDAEHAIGLALLASDLDTANVAEPFPWLAESASRLCQEREMRCGRMLDDAASAGPCVGFLSDGQERYFFELHRFCSDLGRETFAASKDANAPKVRSVADALRARFPDRDGMIGSGQTVVQTFARYSLSA